MVHVVVDLLAEMAPKPVSKYKPGQQSGQQALRTYYPNLYTVSKRDSTCFILP